MAFTQSALHHYLDRQNHFTLHILDGRKILSDLAILHYLNGESLNAYRETILSLLPLFHFLKNNENFSLSIQSQKPFFKLNLEMNSLGNFRTLLLPENFKQFPATINGLAKLTKSVGTHQKSYTSIIELHQLPIKEVINKIFKDSYQIGIEVHVSPYSDMSFMLCQLPNINSTSVRPTLNEYWMMRQKDLQQLALQENPDFIQALPSSLEYLMSKEVHFICPCSKERFLQNLILISDQEAQDLFTDDEIEMRCDYCKKTYKLSKTEFLHAKNS